MMPGPKNFSTTKNSQPQSKMFFEGTHEYRDYNRGGTEKRENHCAVRWINAHRS
jgi:hypothetical protein